MAGNRPKKKYDSNRRVLRKGESQRKNGTYTFRWQDENGDRQQVYAKTLDDLRVIEDEIQQDMLNGISTKGKNVTVQELYETWLKLKRGIRGSTFDAYYAVYTNHIQPVFGKQKVSLIKKSDIKEFYNNLHDQKGLDLRTIELVHNVFRQILNIAVDDRYISSNPTHGAMVEVKKLFKGKKKQRLALTVMEQQRLLSYLRTSRRYQRWYPVIAVMLGTGMRVGETTGLRWQDIDWTTNLIDVNHTLAYVSYRDADGKRRWKQAVHDPKTASSVRKIPMLGMVRDALLEEWQNQKELGWECQATIDGFTDFVFLTESGAPEREDYINDTLKRIVRDANKEVSEGLVEAPVLPIFSCHVLRHTFATRLIEANVNIKVVQDLMGHADAEMTLNVYTDVKLEFKQDQLESFEKAAPALGYIARNLLSELTPKLTPFS